jgi:OOP family OmpA-OmpF porin
MKKMSIVSTVLTGTMAANFAAAQPESVETTESISESTGYLSVLPYYLSVDEDRGLSEQGRGLAIAYGRQGDRGWFWEFQTFGGLIESGQHASTDHYQYGAGIDIGYRMIAGTGASPFVILGVGGVRNDAVLKAEDDTDFTGNAGLGFISGELGGARVRLRGEARYVFDDFETGVNDGMNDWRFGLGVVVPLGRRVVEREIVRERVVTETVTVPAEIVDSDRDGVPDQMDQCPGTLTGLATDSRGCAAESAQTLRLEGVNFETNSATLTPGASATLREVAEALRGEANLRAEIGGHTDSSGADDYNLRLSQQRADSVRAFLMSQGIDGNRLLARGYGETQPVADNSTETGRALNRRVEFRILN